MIYYDDSIKLRSGNALLNMYLSCRESKIRYDMTEVSRYLDYGDNDIHEIVPAVSWRAALACASELNMVCSECVETLSMASYWDS